MKRYKKRRFAAFIFTLAVCAAIMLAFKMLIPEKYGDSSELIEEKSENQVSHAQEFTDIADNVGGISFTEDQMTEIARKIFSLDGFLKDVRLELASNGEISISAVIKDKAALTREYPELEKYSILISAAENKQIKVSGALKNSDGRAAFEIAGVNVGGMPLNKAVVSPFIEAGDFSHLFDIEYDSVEIQDGRIIFKNGVPDILQY